LRSLSSHFVREKFAEYYKKHSFSIPSPTSIEKREFGFLLLKERVMLRHKGFRNVDTLRSFLKTVVPSDVYYSGAYYERPEEEMRGKGWLGADLIFDIDADHIPTPCGKVHDIWVCSNCGAVGRGVSPKKCPTCGEQRFNEKTWPCEVCLESAKVEAIKLMDILTKDFGFSSEELKVGFSGHRGYHVHVESEEVRALDSVARKEIVDYVLGLGLEAEFHGLGERGVKGSRVLAGPELDDFGWRGRIARGTYDLLLTASPEELEKIGLKKKGIDTITQHKETLLESWKEKGPWGIIKGIGPESWRKIARYGVEKQSVKIDTVVTTDIHRLIRLTNTLHGKTGLKKIEVPVTGVERFDPLKSAITFKTGTVTILISDAPQFRLGDETYGPYKEQKIELPTAAALMLLCKGAAKVVE
jgi:DNA primase small subunit